MHAPLPALCYFQVLYNCLLLLGYFCIRILSRYRLSGKTTTTWIVPPPNISTPCLAMCRGELLVHFLEPKPPSPGGFFRFYLTPALSSRVSISGNLEKDQPMAPTLSLSRPLPFSDSENYFHVRSGTVVGRARAHRNCCWAMENRRILFVHHEAPPLSLSLSFFLSVFLKSGNYWKSVFTAVQNTVLRTCSLFYLPQSRRSYDHLSPLRW